MDHQAYAQKIDREVSKLKEEHRLAKVEHFLVARDLDSAWNEMVLLHYE